MAVTKLIDETKCIGCGKCVSDCVTHYLVMSEDENGKRKPTFNNRSRCIDCGHCNAICPQGAVSGGNVITEMENDELLQLMASKRSMNPHFTAAPDWKASRYRHLWRASGMMHLQIVNR